MNESSADPSLEIDVSSTANQKTSHGDEENLAQSRRDTKNSQLKRRPTESHSGKALLFCLKVFRVITIKTLWFGRFFVKQP